MKIVYIAPHLSTGGMPEYLRKKVESLKDAHEVWVMELTYEKNYSTIRDKIEKLIKNNLISLDNNFKKMLHLLEEISPDVIHFEEMSDHHLPPSVLEKIYRPNRTWKIIETLHDSSIDWREKRFVPDKMLVVSMWQVKNFIPLGIPIEIIQHEITTGTRDRSYGMEKLGLNPNQKHILQVGLFSSRKNQKETFEIARMMPQFQFHFVGALTDNYQNYWKELVQNKPQNCTIWGERNDVNLFYSCVDAVIFPSKGSYGDTETNPLAIKEAIAWQVPLLLENIPVYMNMYPESNMIKFMTDDRNKNCKILNDMITPTGQYTLLKRNFFDQDVFDIDFEIKTNKITINYLEDHPYDMVVCVRDLETEVPIYSFGTTFENKSSSWVIPLPKEYYDFYQNPNFSGFLIDFYDLFGKLLTSKTYKIKDIFNPKQKFRIETFEPVFINYEQFFTDGIYDRFFNKINNLELVLDIGSSVGLFTRLARKKGAKKVICFEVSQRATQVFRKVHGDDPHISLVNKAVWDSQGRIKIYEDSENSIISSAFSGSVGDKYFEIDSIDLNTYFSQSDIKKVSLMKMDIEGAEYKAFDGLSDDNLSKIENIILEFHDNIQSILKNQIVKRLEKLGFKLEIFEEDCKTEADINYEEKGVVFASLNGEIKIENFAQLENYPIDEHNVSMFRYEVSETKEPFDYLIPRKTKFNKLRLGPKSDGGYTIADGLEYDALISGGVGDNIDFEMEFLERNKVPHSYIFDGTVDGLPTKDLSLQFFKKNISGVISEESENLHQLLKKHSNIFLKLDIEAWEYNWLESLPEDMLKSVSQLVIEFHYQYSECFFYDGSPVPNPERKIDLFKSILKTHKLIHLSPNNCCGVSSVSGVDIPNVFECTFVRRDLCNSEDYDLRPTMGQNTSWISVIVFNPLSIMDKKSESPQEVTITKDKQNQKTIVIIDCYISSSRVRGRLIHQLKNIKSAGFDVMLVSNTKVDEEVQGLVDFFFYDKRNQLFEHDYQDIQEIVMDDYVYIGQEHLFTLKEQVKGSQKHGLSVIINTHNSVWLAKSLGYENFIRCEVDDLFSTDSINWMKNTENLVSKESKKSLLFFNDYHNEPSNISFHFMFWNIDFFLQTIPKINNEKEYQKLVEKLCKERDFLTVEELYYRLVINKTDDILVYKGEDMEKFMPGTVWNTEFSLSNLVDKFNEFFFRVYRIEDRPGFFLFSRNLTSRPIEVTWKITYNSGKTDTIIQNLPKEIDSWAWNIVDEDLMSWVIYSGQEFVSSGLSSQILNVSIDKSLGQLSTGQINWVEFAK